MEKDNEMSQDSSRIKSGFFKTIKETKDNIKTSGKVQLDSVRQKRDEKREAKAEKKRLKELSPMAKSAPGNITGPIFLIFGLIFLGICLGLGAVFYFLYHRSLTFIILVFVIPLVISLFLLYLGIKQNIHAETYASYRAYFKKQPYAEISKLADYNRQTDSKTIKNLKVFKNEGLFPKGFFTDDNKYFVLSEGAYELLQEDLREKNKNQVRNSEVQNLENNYPKLYKIYNQLNEVKSEIKELKNRKRALKKPQLKDDLIELDYNIKQIQTYILKKPENVPELHNFLDYFLPMLTDLLNTYCELDKSKIRTENIIESQNEIEDSLKEINGALKRMYNDFYQGTAMDVYAEVQVVKSMINKHGFGESDFEE